MNNRVGIADADRLSAGSASPASRADLVERLWAAAQAQVDAYDARLKGHGPGEAAGEANPRALATLARTIRELIDLDSAAIEVDRALEDQDNPHDLNPDSALSDLDSLREELAHRLGGLEPGEEDAASGGAAAAHYQRFEADAVPPVVAVRAHARKNLSAEPVAALYAHGRVRHVGALPELEDEMCDFGASGLNSGRSPDRLDALVWAITHLAWLASVSCSTAGTSGRSRCLALAGRLSSRRVRVALSVRVPRARLPGHRWSGCPPSP